MSIALLSGTLANTGATNSVDIGGNFNVSLSGFGTATVAVERSLDDGETWLTVEAFTTDVERRGFEPELGAKYRINCTSYTSGTIAYRISR